MMESVLVKERWLHVLGVSVLALFVLSLPFKLATVHVAGGLLLLTAFGLRRNDFGPGPVRAFAETSLAWLVPVMLAGLWHAFSNTPSAAPFAETVKVWARILGVGLGLLVLLQREYVSLRAVTLVMLAAIVVVAASGYYEWFVQWQAGRLPDWSSRRISGWVFHPNPFAFCIALGVVISAALLRARQGGTWPWPLIAVSVPLLWASGSRGSIIAVLAGLCCLVSVKDRRLLWVLSGVGVALAVAYGMDWLDFQRAGSDRTRGAILRFALAKWVEAPWFGWGIGSLPVLEGHVQHQAAHNVLIDLAVSCGALAIAGWCYATGRMLLGLWHSSHPAARGVLAALVVVLVSGLVDYSLLTATIYQGAWVLAAVLACWVAPRQAGAPEGAK